jgi:hypothetical protein
MNVFAMVHAYLANTTNHFGTKMRVLATWVRVLKREDVDTVLKDTLLELEKTERGQWLKTNSYRPLEFSDPIMDVETFAYKVAVWVWLKDADLTYYTLKWK